MSVFCYQRHINDWRRDTGDLTLEEKGAYSELLDWFYITEGRLPADLPKLYRLLSVQTDSERLAVAVVVERYFSKTLDGFLIQKRAHGELEKMHDKSKKASKNSLSRKFKNIASTDADLSLSGGSANQEPITNNQREEKTLGVFDVFWELFPRQRRVNRKKAMSAYARALTRDLEGNIHAGLIRYCDSDEVARGFAKGAEAWLNDDRWKVQYKPSKPSNKNGPNSKPTNYERALFAGVTGRQN